MMKTENTKPSKKSLRQEKLSALLNAADQELQKEQPMAEVTESFEKLYQESLNQRDFKVGDVVKGRVTAVEEDHVLVDINYKSEGIIPKSEFRLVAGQGDLEVGQEMDVYIERIENENGMMVLSKDRADIIRVWKDISKVVENEEVIDGTVIEKVKGGLSVDIGVKAFLPGSQIELRSVHNLDTYIGKKLKFKVIKFNQKRGNIVLSRRVLLNQERKSLRSQTLSEIKEGAIVKGIVKNITDYGAFLDLGGLDGLLHITDMSWSRIKHPSEILSLGEEKEVKILKFDVGKNRVSLGLKQLEEDPWHRVSQEIKIGDVVKATVVSLTDYGAFMKLRDGVEGLVHVSEMSWSKKIKHPSEILKEADSVDVKILGIDKENHRISLGIRQLQANPWLELKEKYSVGLELQAKIKSITDYGLFVGIEGESIDGFIHVSDLSWTQHINPKKEYKEGETVTCFVKDVNTAEERFNLSLKKMEGDPWLQVESKYPPGSRHEVKVVKWMDFGVFVELEPGVEGLIHVSELSAELAEQKANALKVGDKIKAEVLSIDLDARKIGLSIKQVELHEDIGIEPIDKSQEVSKDSKKKESFFGRALKASLAWQKPQEESESNVDVAENHSASQPVHEQTNKEENVVTKEGKKE